MTENLISEGIGVIVELTLVYFLINWILESREKKKWKPVIQSLLYRVERVEGWFNVAFTQLASKKRK